MGFTENTGRRRFLLKQLLPLTFSGFAMKSARADVGGERSLYLHNLHTQERLECWYYLNGEYVPQALKQIDRVFRDHRTGEVHEIDVDLLDTLFFLKNQFAIDGPVEIISGFRSVRTNEMLRRQSSGVARRSYHMVGRAVDCRFPGVATRELRDVAIHTARGGVGYYRRSNFVHLDTGPVRNW